MDHAVSKTTRLQQFAVLVSIISASTASLLGTTDAAKEPYYTSVLSGSGWVLELLAGHPERIRCELGVSNRTFVELVTELQMLGHKNAEHDGVSLEEQLAIFLYTCVTGLPFRHVAERFQRSTETISQYFHKILTTLSSPPFYADHMRSPTEEDPPSAQIRQNATFWPFFKDALGAMDCSHIPCTLPGYCDDRSMHRNQMGFVSQNCLFACSFDHKFVPGLTGWEGSASDACVYESHARHFNIPEGKYYLADASFPPCKGLLVPYRGVLDDLAAWRITDRPENKEELFNLRHAVARNAITRLLCAIRRRFRILLLSPDHGIHLLDQARIPAALCALHNFICERDPDEGRLPRTSDPFDRGMFDSETTFPEVAAEEADVVNEGTKLRDEIAQAMWDDYKRYCVEHGMVGMDFDREFGDEEMDEDEDLTS